MEIAVGVLVAFLLALSAWAAIVDARERRIPNPCCVAVAACGVLLQVVRVSSGALSGLSVPLACLAWAAALLVVGVGVELAFRSLRGRSGMGLGDVKYASAWAVTLGWLTLPAIAAACLLGAAWALVRRQRTFALGPWLSLAFALLLLATCLA